METGRGVLVVAKGAITDVRGALSTEVGQLMASRRARTAGRDAMVSELPVVTDAMTAGRGPLAVDTVAMAACSG